MSRRPTRREYPMDPAAPSRRTRERTADAAATVVSVSGR